MNKQKIFSIAFNLFFIACFFTLGWASSELYDVLDYQRQVSGLYMRNYDYSDAKDLAYDRDEYGDWVCVNIRDMSYNRCKEVVSHECGHEIWAEACESNDELCRKAQELLNKYNRGN